jgi:hypothetical protein
MVKRDANNMVLEKKKDVNCASIACWDTKSRHQENVQPKVCCWELLVALPE